MPGRLCRTPSVLRFPRLSSTVFWDFVLPIGGACRGAPYHGCPGLKEGVTIETVVETRGLSKRYRTGVLAVDNLNLSVRRGEVYGFLGPNGAGKTTTMRMLVGLLRPSAGAAVVAGHPPGTPAGLARLGALVEQSAFYPYLSGRDNLRVMARYTGLGPKVVETALEEVDLTDRAHHKFKTYSTGMKQRLGVAAALMKEPELLILDEPTAGLDPQGTVEMRNLIKHMASSDRAVLLSSHLLSEVEQTCDRVGVIQRGRLITEGTVDELRGQALLEVLATPVERAQAVLAQLVGADKVRLVDGRFQLNVDPSRAAEVNRQLVADGIDVSELRLAERSLEEVFLQLTEEGPKSP
jgi:ABC-2 type transport system ATP-binding protein